MTAADRASQMQDGVTQTKETVKPDVVICSQPAADTAPGTTTVS